MKLLDLPLLVCASTIVWIMQSMLIECTTSYQRKHLTWIIVLSQHAVGSTERDCSVVNMIKALVHLSFLTTSCSCTKCPDGDKNWWKFVAIVFIALTIFYSIIVIFKINVTSSRLHGVIRFSQTISVPALILLFQILVLMWVLYNPCMVLTYIIAFYPLVLVFISYYMIVLYYNNYKGYISPMPPRVLFDLRLIW